MSFTFITASFYNESLFYVAFALLCNIFHLSENSSSEKIKNNIFIPPNSILSHCYGLFLRLCPIVLIDSSFLPTLLSSLGSVGLLTSHPILLPIKFQVHLHHCTCPCLSLSWNVILHFFISNLDYFSSEKAWGLKISRSGVDFLCHLEISELGQILNLPDSVFSSIKLIFKKVT